ncbi:MAG TPA: arsenic resistance N-acetyltransferase ArsN2 [Mucilaginibacter sp.]
MEITEAINYRDSVVALIAAERLPTEDLQATLENFRIAIQNDEVIGVAGLEIYGDYGLLRSLAVQPAHRDKGIASKLLKQIEALAGSKGLKAICLLTETAAAYFNKKGYSTITRGDVPTGVQGSSEFSHVCPQSAIVMIKNLPR